mmetsp:Transcript_24686/g.80936  ORF Transcript_24686/g.80936 Transcript_24686/m.80936 type:complete len:108 (+) Transcript_24686:483-806(+)
MLPCPPTAWSNAIGIVGCIGGTVICITAVGTYFIAKAENKKLKKAKKQSNLLGGRYGAVKKEADSDDEPAPQYEPMQVMPCEGKKDAVCRRGRADFNADSSSSSSLT